MLLTCLLATAALAEPGVSVNEKPVASQPEETAAVDRDYLMEVNFRTRWLSIPDNILDAGFYNEQDQNGLHPERPSVRALALGLEYVVRQGPANGIFYVEYVNSLMDEGYWDDVDDDANFTDGDYLKPDRLGMVTLGGNYGYALTMNPGNPNVEVAFMFGGGLGIGFLTGKVDVYDGYADPTTGQFYSAYEAYQQDPGQDPDDTLRIPRVLPVVDINAGLRFVIAEKANVRLEGGVHDMLYLGGAAGIMF